MNLDYKDFIILGSLILMQFLNWSWGKTCKEQNKGWYNLAKQMNEEMRKWVEEARKK